MSLIDWEYGLEVLRNRVVRVVFKKKGNGNFREMWATRNTDLIAKRIGVKEALSLDEDRQRLAQQKRNNNLVVFDLEKNEFRTIPLDNIVPVDQFTGVPGWIEFKFSEPWEDIIKGKIHIYDYVNYNF